MSTGFRDDNQQDDNYKTPVEVHSLIFYNHNPVSIKIICLIVSTMYILHRYYVKLQ